MRNACLHVLNAALARSCSCGAKLTFLSLLLHLVSLQPQPGQRSWAQEQEVLVVLMVTGDLTLWMLRFGEETIRKGHSSTAFVVPVQPGLTGESELIEKQRHLNFQSYGM